MSSEESKFLATLSVVAGYGVQATARAEAEVEHERELRAAAAKALGDSADAIDLLTWLLAEARYAFDKEAMLVNDQGARISEAKCQIEELENDLDRQQDVGIWLVEEARWDATQALEKLKAARQEAAALKAPVPPPPVIEPVPTAPDDEMDPEPLVQPPKTVINIEQKPPQPSFQPPRAPRSHATLTG